MQVTFEAVKAAAKLIEGRVLRTPFIPSMKLSEVTGVDVCPNLENPQHTGALKVPRALDKLLRLTDADRKSGVTAASARTHSPVPGSSARPLTIPATPAMPSTYPLGTPTRMKPKQMQIKIIIRPAPPRTHLR